MPLREDFQRAGTGLFRWRSYLPLPVFVLLLAQIPDFRYFGGTHATDLAWEAFCLLISVSGLTVRVLTVGHAPRGTSGRNTRAPAAEQLNTTGLYSVVRHPLYLGNFFMWLGVALFLHTWWIVLVAVLCFALYYERIMFAEEEFLRARFGDAYLRWAERTPAFIPNPRLWRRPSLPFSWRAALRREYGGLFGLIVAFAVLEVATDWAVYGSLELDWVWLVLLGAAAVFYGTVRFLKRRTTVLEVPGR